MAILGTIRKRRFTIIRSCTPTRQTDLASKGVAADSLGDHLQAMKFFNQALKINPHDLYANDGMGEALISLRNYKGAAYYFNSALTTYPNHFNALLGKGLALYWAIIQKIKDLCFTSTKPSIRDLMISQLR